MNGPSPSWLAITPHDTDPQGGPFRGISFAVAGDLVLLDLDGNALATIPSGSLAPGVIHPVIFGRVMAATTATGVVGYK
jgi:hypothetical protein